MTELKTLDQVLITIDKRLRDIDILLCMAYNRRENVEQYKTITKAQRKIGKLRVSLKCMNRMDGFTQ